MVNNTTSWKPDRKIALPVPESVHRPSDSWPHESRRFHGVHLICESLLCGPLSVLSRNRFTTDALRVLLFVGNVRWFKAFNSLRSEYHLSSLFNDPSKQWRELYLVSDGISHLDDVTNECSVALRVRPVVSLPSTHPSLSSRNRQGHPTTTVVVKAGQTPF